MKTECSFAPEQGSEARTGEVLELSERGMFVASNTLYPPGTALALFLTLPGKRLPVRLRGEVAWARTAGRAGMYVRLADATAAEDRPDRPASAPGEPKKPHGPKLSSES